MLAMLALLTLAILIPVSGERAAERRRQADARLPAGGVPALCGRQPHRRRRRPQAVRERGRAIGRRAARHPRQPEAPLLQPGAALSKCEYSHSQ